MKNLNQNNLKWIVVFFYVFSSKFSFATSDIQILFVKEYRLPANSLLNACDTCHSPATSETLNPYGQALKLYGLNFKKIETFDSDIDGKNNKVEIDSQMWPGSQAGHDGNFYYKAAFHTIPVKFSHENHIKILLKKGKTCDTCHKPGLFIKHYVDKSMGINAKFRDMVHGECTLCHSKENVPNAFHPDRRIKCKFCHTDFLGGPQ